jgi:hypothetical protein
MPSFTFHGKQVIHAFIRVGSIKKYHKFITLDSFSVKLVIMHICVTDCAQAYSNLPFEFI